VALDLTEYQVSLTGLHARNEKTIQATQDWERSRINDDALKAAFDKDCESIVELQKHVGVEYITDGQITPPWQDLFRPISTGFEGIEPGPMVRWFNTNTFFYIPVVYGPISSSGKVLWNAVEGRFVNHGSSLKIVLPDPLTFAELAEDRYYGTKEKVLFAYSDAIRRELRSLSSRGLKYVQFSAPSLVYRLRGKPLPRDDFKQLAEAVRNALRGVSLRSGYYPFFGDASVYLPDLFELIPTDDVGIDLTQTDDSSLPETQKGIIAGLVDSRTTYLENVSTLRSRAQDIAERTKAKRVTLSPSSDLRYIPRVSADEKLELLGRLKPTLKRGLRAEPKSKKRRAK
jgi:5-methyltetrahydropteroyltriglutamate--homocysteine methyltransferase